MGASSDAGADGGSITPADVSVTISTLFERPRSLASLLDSLARQSRPPGEVVVVVQGTNGDVRDQFCEDVVDREYPYALVHEFQDGRGLSRGRNRAVELASGRVLCVADDDCVYHATAIAELADLFDRFGEADVVRFRARARDQSELKDYRTAGSDAYEPRYRELFRISSIELAVRARVLEELPVLFDEEFGLGTRYPSGEETIMAVRLWRSGCRFLFVRSELVVHDDEPGDDKRLSAERFYSKGALFRRLYGRVGLLPSLGFAVKKWYGSDRSPGLWPAVRAVLRGYRDYGRRCREPPTASSR